MRMTRSLSRATTFCKCLLLILPFTNLLTIFRYSELDSTQTSSTIVKPLASDIPANVPYQLVFYWAASAVFEEGDCSFTFTFGSFTQTLGISYLGSPYSYLSYTLYFTPTESASTMQITTSCEDISGFPAFIFDDFSLNYDAQ